MTGHRALLVGINAYPSSPLNGCVNDTTSMAELLTSPTYNFKSENIRLLVDARATTAAILDHLNWLVQVEPGATILFQYSGHGAQVPTRNDAGEVDNLLEVICVGESMHIPTDCGLLQAHRVYDLVRQGYEVKTKINNKFHKITQAVKTRKESEVRVRLSNNTVLQIGEDHPVFVFDNGIIRQVKGKDIRQGDQLLRSSQFFNKGGDIDEVWYLVGLFVGDGHFVKSCANVIHFNVRSYLNRWFDVIEMIKRNFDDSKISHKIYQRKKYPGDELFISINSPKFATLLRSLGFKPGRKMGGINELPLPFDEKCLRGFIRGYFDADGTSSKTSIRFLSIDRELINLIDTALNYFGVKVDRCDKISKKRNHNKCYIATCYNSNAKKYADVIGFGFSEKNKLSNEKITKSGDKDGVDLSVLVNLIDRYNLRWCDFTNALGLEKRSYTRLRNRIFRSDQVLAMVNALQEKVVVAHDILDGDDFRRLEIGASIGNIEHITGVNQFSAFNRLEKNNQIDVCAYAEKMIDEIEPILNRSWNILKNYNLIRVDEVNIIKMPCDMYDFTIEDEKKFEINGVLVHNCPVDFDWSPGRMITDKQFVEIFKKIPAGVTFNWLSDSCHSGDLDRIMPPSGTKFRRFPVPADILWRQKIAVQKKLERWFKKSKAMACGMLDVGFMSGCQSDQTSADAYIDGRPCGAFTYYFMKAVKENPKMKLDDLGDLIAKYLRNGGYSQRPSVEGARKGQVFLNPQ